MDESASITAFAREAIFGLAEQGAQVEATDEVWEHPIPAFAALGEAFASVAFAPPVQDALAERDARNDEEWVVATAAELTVPDMATWHEPCRTWVESRKRYWDPFARVLEIHYLLISQSPPRSAPPLQEWTLISPT